MIKHYFTIAWRNLTKNYIFSLINIAGLAIGMAAAALILLWVHNEYNQDGFHKNGKRIYQAWNKANHNGKIGTWGVTPQPMAAAIKKDYDEVELTARQNWTESYLFNYDNAKIKGRVNFVDSSFVNMFSFSFMLGDKHTCLDQPESAVLTKSFSKKLFGDIDPLNKTVQIDNQYLFKVTGIIEDLPSNTQFDFECLLPFSFMEKNGFSSPYWGNNSTTTWVMTRDEISIGKLQDKIKTLRKSYDEESGSWETFLYPLDKLHLFGKFENGVETGGRIKIVRIFAIVAFMILLIACINFMNLSTARSEKRAKEVGIRKVIGAYKSTLVRLFLSESIVLAFFSGVLACIIIYCSLNPFNEVLGVNINLDWTNSKFILLGIAFILATGLLAGSYPSLYLSSFKPVAVLKGGFRKIGSDITPRKLLVISQFTFSILLITATIIVKKQLDYALNRDTGYDRKGLVYHTMEGDITKNANSIKNELLQSNLAESITFTFSPITEGWSNTGGMEWKGKPADAHILIDRYSADDAVVKTLGLQLLQGRDFDLKNFPSDSDAVIINEAALKVMGFDSPIGQIIKDGSMNMNVIGVVKDVIIRSPYKPVGPMTIAGIKRGINIMHVKYNIQKNINESLVAAEKIFKKYNPNYPFQYQFVDEEYAKKFNDETRISKLSYLFSFLTIFISCLGLFGLVTYMAQNRMRELGIRKVLGASTWNVVNLLSKDFLMLVFIALIIATPLAYWLMNKWLLDYDYRIKIDWSMFGIAGVLALLIAGITVITQAIRAAWMNPTKSLRSE